jgi:hypothetical protein
LDALHMHATTPKPLLTAYRQASHEALADFPALDGRCLANVVSAARDAPKFCGRRVLLSPFGGENAGRGISPHAEGVKVRTERRHPSASPPNGSVVKLHGQGPRAEAEAARRLLACEARDAGGVTPSARAAQGSSAAGPKPGRVGFYRELGRGGDGETLPRITSLNFLVQSEQ